MVSNSPGVWTPKGTIHLKPGTGLYYLVSPQHTEGERLTGIDVFLGSRDGSLRFTPQKYPWTMLNLDLDPSKPIQQLVTITEPVPQNFPMRTWARTQYNNGVWGAWNLCDTDIISPDTPPTLSNSPTPSPQGTVDVLNSQTVFEAKGRVTDPDGDRVTFYVLEVEGVNTTFTWSSGQVPCSIMPGEDFTIQGPTLQEGFQYRWRIRFWAENRHPIYDGPGPYSGWHTFTYNLVEPDPVSPPYLVTDFALTPSGQIAVDNDTYTTTIKAKWSDTFGDRITAYRLIIKTDTDETVVDTGKIDISAPLGAYVVSVNAPSLQVNVHYFWQMCVWDSFGNISQFSPLQEFWAVSAAGTNYPPTVTPLVPSHNAQIGTTTPTFSGRFKDAGTRFNTFGAYRIEVRRVSDDAVMWNTTTIAANNAEKMSRQFDLTYGHSRGAGSPIALSYDVPYKWRAQVLDNGGLSSALSSYQTFTCRRPPNVPTGLGPTGTLLTVTPTFSGNYSHPSGAALSGVQVLVYKDTETNRIWDSGVKSASGSTWSVLYEGPTLNPSDTVYWQVRVFDVNGVPSAYSGLVYCTVQSTPRPPTNLSPVTDYQTVYPEKSGITFAGDYQNDSGASMNAARVIVYRPDGVTPIWDSGTVVQSGSRFRVPYLGPTLAPAGYLWKAQTRASDTGFWGPFCPLQSLTLNKPPTTPTALSPRDTNVPTSVPVMTWQSNTGDATQRTTGAPDGQRPVFHLINIIDKSTGLPVSGFPKTTGQVWDDFTSFSGWSTSGTWAVTSGVLGLTVGAAHGRCHRNSGTGDGFVGARVKYIATARTGLILRLASGNSWLALVFDGDSLALIKNNAGTVTTIGSVAIDISNGQWHHLAVDLSGSTIYCYFNGKQVMQVTDSFNATSTSHGLYADNTTAAQFDDFYVATGTSGANTYTPTLSLNKQYDWAVATFDGFSLGPYSPTVQFRTEEHPQVSIDSPTEGNTVTAPNMTVNWTYFSSGGFAQSKYRVVVRQAGATVYDSSSITSTEARSHTLPVGFLLNGGIYQVYVTTEDVNGRATTSVGVTFITQWTPPPGIEEFTASTVEAEGTIRLTWKKTDLASNEFLRYELRRVIDHEDGTQEVKLLLKTSDMLTTSFIDYFAPAHTDVTYLFTQVKAVGAEEVPSAYVSGGARLRFKGMWLMDVEDPATYSVHLWDNPSRSFTWNRDEEDVQYWGRERPVRHIGTSLYQSFSVSARLLGSDDPNAPTEDETPSWRMLQTLIERRKPICYRDARGRKLFANFSLSETDGMPYEWGVSLSLVETDYDEEV